MCQANVCGKRTGAFEDPAVLDFSGCRLRLPQGNSRVKLLLFQQSFHNKYDDVGWNRISHTRLPETWKGSGCRIRCGDRMQQPDTWNGGLCLPFHVSDCRIRLPHPFFRLDECRLLSSFLVSGERVRQTQVRLKIQQCWISAVAACVCRKEIPFWRHYLRCFPFSPGVIPGSSHTLNSKRKNATK